MVTTKKISRYSDEYAETFIAALDAPVRIKLPTSTAAKRLRERYYAFRRYLETITIGESPDADRAAVLAPLARMSIKRNTLTIYYEVKETTDDRPSINASTNTSADDTSG